MYKSKLKEPKLIDFGSFRYMEKFAIKKRKNFQKKC